MTDSGFADRLRATFLIEAKEHLDEMTGHLLALERAPGDAASSAQLECIYRAAHSLKGAARAVNATEVEGLCQELESVFALLKKGRLALQPAMLESFHRTVDQLGVQVEQPESVDAGAVAALVSVLRGHMASPEAASASRRAAPRAEERAVTPASRSEGAETSRRAAERPARRGVQTVRVPAERLEAMLRQVEEIYALCLERQEFGRRLHGLRVQLQEQLHGLGQVEGQRAQPALRAELGKLEAASFGLFRDHRDAMRQFTVAVEGLLNEVRQLQMSPVATLLDPLPKFVRELAKEQGKTVRVDITGAEIEVDRRILEQLRDPLTHMVRNAVDHGIEPPEKRSEAGKPAEGHLVLQVVQRKSQEIELSLADDGRGIDVAGVRKKAVELGMLDGNGASETEAIDLIFASGISTSPLITDLSGHGLGLAIAREKVEAVGGRIGCSTTPGAGTVFRFVLPTKLSSFRALEVRVGTGSYLIPGRHVLRVLRVPATEVVTVGNVETITVEGRAVTLAPLAVVLEMPPSERERPGATLRNVVVLHYGDALLAFTVDAVAGDHDVLMRGLGAPLARVRNVAGVTLGGKAEPRLVLHVGDLFKGAQQMGAPGRAGEAAGEAKAKRVLVADDSVTSRVLLRDILAGAGYQVATAVDGMDAYSQLREGRFDVLVSDVDMPRLDGFALTAKIRADTALARTPVILVTSLASREDRERGIEAGANAYVIKSSFDQSNLLEILDRFV